MKRIALMMVVVIVSITTARSTGNEPDKSRVQVLPGNERYKIIYTGEVAQKVTIRLRDADGRLLRTDRVRNTSGFMKPYSIANLPEGSYVFEVTDHAGLVSHTVDIPIKGPSNMMDIREIEEKKYRLIVDQKADFPLKLTIYDSGNKIIHSETFDDLKAFSRDYDLSEFRSDNFTFELMDVTSRIVVSMD